MTLPSVPALGQPSSTVQISIDSPPDGATVATGTPVDLGGWAADPAGAGTGVDIVRVYLDNRMESGGTLLGDAAYGHPRPDVAAALGWSAFTYYGSHSQRPPL